MLLKLLAYNDKTQQELLPSGWEIEHIFPKKWQPTYFNLKEDEANKLIEMIGNKTPFEKKLNIIAGNGYFAKKKEQYKKSNIAITKSIGFNAIDDWTMERITERNTMVIDEVTTIFNSWDN